MDIQEQLISIQKSIDELKLMIVKNQPNIITDKWVPLNDVKIFFNYGSTQMSVLEKNSDLRVAKIGRRKYIHRDSITRLLEKNVVRQ